MKIYDFFKEDTAPSSWLLSHKMATFLTALHRSN